MGGADKFRLYLAVYDNSKAAGSGLPLQLHWALLLGPKHEDASSLQKTHARYHATNRTRTGRWEFERRAVECVRTPSMLGRILLGKIEPADLDAVERVLADPRRVKVEDARWDCWKWVEDALVDLLQKGLLRMQARDGVNMRHLLAYGQRFSTEVVERGLDTGYGMPVTVVYPGPGPIPTKIIK
ncbi:hypothetical protein C8Q70DRAFT_1055030 [Cubamyces menziesii]|uniref:Uncharacterized protein n=1 Tax=Trametes cubensis TaxID=1111947 RepID=A0AAD7TWY5_9APHY|nr:hypothetical protein C8Q70DRAFT_1055030 [Cubamyces menziesii]KAJ8487603.1 hypothetical protein ONZ51_g4070 [Trametes cubensis]